MNKSTHSNPFMKRTETKTEESRWVNLDINEEPKKNRFKSETNTDDAFRNKENSFSKHRSRRETSRNFRRGETFNYSLQYGERESSNKKSAFGGSSQRNFSSFMKFTAPKPATPPPEFNLDEMKNDFPSLA